MSFFLRPAIVTAVLAFSLTGCNSTANTAKIVAEVNGTPITTEDVAYREVLPHGFKPKNGEKTVQDIIDEELLYQQGVKLGLLKHPLYKAKLAELEKGPAAAKRLEVARRVFNSQIASRVDVRYEEGKQYYQQHASQMGKELHLQLAKFDKKEKALEALKKLRQGAQFSTVAGGSAATPSGGNPPWDLGFVKWQDVPVDFEETLYSLKPGEVTGVLGSQQAGFQIVKMVESRNVPRPEYAAISTVVLSRLRDLKLLQTYQQYVAKLRDEAQIVTF